MTTVGATIVLEKPWLDHTPAEQATVVGLASRGIDSGCGLQVPTALLSVAGDTRDDPDAPGKRVHVVSVYVEVPRPWCLPSGSPVATEWRNSGKDGGLSL